jgi:hypothetical protein
MTAAARGPFQLRGQTARRFPAIISGFHDNTSFYTSKNILPDWGKITQIKGKKDIKFSGKIGLHFTKLVVK